MFIKFNISTIKVNEHLDENTSFILNLKWMERYNKLYIIQFNDFLNYYG